MKKWFAFLLALLLMCACLPAVHAESSEFPVPLETKDVPLPDCMKSGEGDLKVQRNDNKWTFSWGQSSFEDAETSLYTYFIYSTEDEPDIYVQIEKTDIVKTATGWSYTWEEPKNLIEDSVYFVLTWEKGTDEKGRTDFYQSYLSWDDSYTKSYEIWRPGEADMVGGVSDSFDVSNNNLTSYVTDGVYGTYEDGKLIKYAYYIGDVGDQYVEFDVYGRIVSSSLDDDHYYQWNEEEGWFYCDEETGETCYLDSVPKGAVEPQSVEAPYALPVPKIRPVTSTYGQGVMTKLPVSLNDMADIEEAGFVENGKYAVTLSGDLKANDYTTDDEHYGFGDVGVLYMLDGELYGIWFVGNEEDTVTVDGNTFYFTIPGGADILYATVDMSIVNGEQYYYSCKNSDGTYESSFNGGPTGKDDENFTYEYWYNEDGELHSIGVKNELDGSQTYWHFNGASGELTDYEIEAEEDYWITYRPDGSVASAKYQDADGNGLYWEPGIGWFEYAEDEDGNGYKKPVSAPEGIDDPTAYSAPYVLVADVEPEIPTPPWYPHNTVCVGGIAFRDVKPELTNKWYNFAAVDLSQDSVQTFELVASNKFVVGVVTVSRTGDEVVVDWALRKQGTTDANFISESEFFTFFPSLDAVTEVEPEKLEGPAFRFGEPISIEKDLGGDTNVLLYVRNVATYCENLSYKYQRPIFHAVYDAKDKDHRMLREAMQAIMDADQMK